MISSSSSEGSNKWNSSKASYDCIVFSVITNDYDTQILFLVSPLYTLPYKTSNLLIFLISAAFFAAALIRGRRLLEGGAYLIIYLWSAALIGGRRLFEARRLLEEIRYYTESNNLFRSGTDENHDMKTKWLKVVTRN